MVRSARRQASPADAVGEPRRPEHKVVGFIGRGTVNHYEAASLRYIGQCIARLGHTLLIVPAKGAASALREGVEAQEGEVRTLEAGVLDVADRTLLYPDTLLLARLKTAYPDLEQRENVVIIEDTQLDQWVDAMKEILDAYNIPRP